MAESNGSEASLMFGDVNTRFQAVDVANINVLIDTIKIILKRKTTPKHQEDNPNRSSEITTNTEKLPMWASFIQSGVTFLSSVNDHMKKYFKTVDPFRSRGQVLCVISDILEAVGKIHWVLAGLSVIGHLLTKIAEMSDNRDECLHLLQYMVDLADHIIKLSGLVPQEREKLKNALVIIVKGSMLCAKQLYSNTLFRFVKSSLDMKNLSSLRAEINVLYPDLQLTAVIAMMQQQPERLPVGKTDYPPNAVGIEERERKVEELLHMDPRDESFRAVVIYGIGGIGKTFLAKAVHSKLNLNGYNYCRVLMDIDPQKNDIKKKQEQILKDAFPSYNCGRAIDLRDQEEGREHLRRAFQESNKPVFLFIDNVLGAEDLIELLPQDLERFGKHIRLLLTTRNLNNTNMFKKRFRHGYLVKPLPNSDAKKILCNETENLIHIKDDVDRILEICNGVPLVLKIVGAHLENQEYKVKNCSQLLNALEKGDEIREQNLSECMVDFVYKKFENFTQEAFLDICCFFNGMYRTLVESAVGSQALKALEDAALITTKLEKEYYAPMQENEEIVVVHDVIIAKGQNMAKSTRLRDIKSFETAVEEKRLENIKGIELWCDKDPSSYILKRQHLNSMSKSLRVLKLGPNISVSHESKMGFPELRYVYLDHNIPFVPFNSKALTKLVVYVGPLLKRGLSIYMLPENLRQISTFQSDEKCRNWDESKPMQVAPKSSLQELSLTSFSMKTLPKGLQAFSALKTLTLDDWYEMEELPEVICGLHWLSTLSLVKCSLKHLPQSFGNLTSLTHLSLEACDRLEELPSSLQKLKALRFLNLKRCTSLKKLPSNFGELRALQGLNMKKCVRLDEIPGFKKLTALRYLNIQDCPALRRDFSSAHKDLQIEEKGSEEEEELPNRSRIRCHGMPSHGIPILIHELLLQGAPKLDMHNNKIQSNNRGKWSLVVGSVIMLSLSRYLYYQMLLIDSYLDT
ncbi:probable disease resistance protein At5g66900 isoform X2 [Cryptomeria japonica]|uniref:probable disease resistance protein At5g66900 isoform X2 n=1 Tax=Cryptomeria japonica TaxID=3369 RepID=UPI0027DA669A|nr:probable disease resistance protein At5g66900 isoform X2 [Cryptomeria japonica]